MLIKIDWTNGFPDLFSRSRVISLISTPITHEAKTSFCVTHPPSCMHPKVHHRVYVCTMWSGTDLHLHTVVCKIIYALENKYVEDII